ncbi:NUDIX hydrolase [Bacillus suaedae]|uniref:CoA pyrophosphatase n=1 Tax=Halalkalibacter suaedae TaxID=2822140 RepID=A0A940WZ46_9BACI|nr:CoA pyrophosphatase [Bacillus suaedae]MBP3951360.1 CoA pyrophosphatase [Bacillus suaedae]
MKRETISHIEKQLANRKVGILGQDQMKNAAVILPLINVNDQLSLLFEVRSHTLNTQPGEICFPGGRIDQTDSSPSDAAIRELTEELLIDRKHVNIIADLDILVTPFRGIIYPFVATLDIEFQSLKPNLSEVDHLFTVPLSHFYSHSPECHQMSFSLDPINNGPLTLIKNRSHILSQHFYYYDDYIIWGLTANILKHFIELTKD